VSRAIDPGLISRATTELIAGDTVELVRRWAAEELRMHLARVETVARDVPMEVAELIDLADEPMIRRHGYLRGATSGRRLVEVEEVVMVGRLPADLATVLQIAPEQPLIPLLRAHEPGTVSRCFGVDPVSRLDDQGGHMCLMAKRVFRASRTRKGVAMVMTREYLYDDLVAAIPGVVPRRRWGHAGFGSRS
jgi:hypothetical protein